MESEILNPILCSLIKDIKIVVLDVDGILTDGKIYFNGEKDEIKAFNILDGFGIKLLQENGIKVAILTGRKSDAVLNRAKELKIRHIIQGREDKLIALKELLADINLDMKETAYMGDDFPDLKAITAVKLGATIPTANPIIKNHADWVSTKNGGDGAVREFADLILQGKGVYLEALKNFIPHVKK